MARTALWCHQTILHQSKARKQSKIKRKPQRCHAAHAVLPELFISIPVFFRTICASNVLSVLPHPLYPLCTLGLCSYWLCLTPDSQGLPLQSSNMSVALAAHSAFQESLQKLRHLALLLLCSSLRWMYCHTPTIICFKTSHLQWKKKKIHMVIAFRSQVILHS